MNLIERRRWMMSGGGGEEPNYLRFTALQNSSSVSLNETGTPPTLNLEYRLNGGNWTALVYGTAVSLNEGDYIELRKSDDGVAQVSSSSGTRKFVFTGSVNGSGNVMYLTDKTGENTTVGDFGMRQLFNTTSQLKSCPDLPALSVGLYGYRDMFTSSGLVGSIHVQATTLGTAAMQGMFNGAVLYETIRFATINNSSLVVNNGSNIVEFIIDDPTPPTIASNTISGLKSTCIIYVPDASVNAYKAAQYWDLRANYIKGISERPT